MQLGTRWASGDEPPRAVPDVLRAAIADVDRAVEPGSRAHWTLTWLEGRPIAELDTGWEVLVDHAGDVVSRAWED
ncbi:MAG: hypothetical protein QM611_11375 [Microbacterium sp.]|uniref:hypothetical protein n=1 Tax=Microbacterium sp. TaxID=51671 RepID=UPI0039E59D0E